MIEVKQNCVTEWTFESSTPYDDPYNEIELDVIVTDPDGHEQRVPAFWAGGQTWHMRYSSPVVGSRQLRSECCDQSNDELHGVTGELTVTPYDGDNPLLRHGPLQAKAGGRYMEHHDGTPFFWLADTWWMGFCERFRWPDDFHLLTEDRVEKGYNVIQIVAGLYPDMPWLDERGRNEAGFPWDEPYEQLNPAYFDMADRRIQHLVDNGLVPCIVGCWGWFLVWTGVEKMKRHWRNLIARWGAYPVVWTLSGEAAMPFYLSESREEDADLQRRGWTELGHYVREADPFGRMATIHPTRSGRAQVEDVSVMDVEMLQTGHDSWRSVPQTVQLVNDAYDAQPTMPFFNSEVCYEGIGEASRDEVQRFMFWTCVLSGACGHTYGANGIWQFNGREVPYGASPHGMAWGHTPWEEAYKLKGCAHLAIGKRILEQFEWWRFERHLEWIEPTLCPPDYYGPTAAGIPGQLRVIYLQSTNRWTFVVKHLEADAVYSATLHSPIDASQHLLGDVKGDSAGDWAVPLARPPVFHDWILVLQKKG